MTSIAIGGNFDESSADSFSGLIDFLSQQDFADKLVNVNFKPIVRNEKTPKVSAALAVKGMLPLIPVGANGKPLGGTCMSNVGDGGGVGCDSCDFLDDKMALLRRGDQAPRLLHAGRGARRPLPRAPHARAHDRARRLALRVPRLHRRESDVDRPHRRPAGRKAGSALEQFERLHPWDECQDCAFIPTCAGGCLVASHTQLGDMNKPTCHKRSFESALISLAHDVASAA